MVKVLLLLRVTTNSHPLSISLDTTELIKENWEKEQRKLLQPHVLFFFPPFFLTPKKQHILWCLHGSIMARKFCIEECSARCWPRLLPAQSADSAKDIFSLQHSSSSLLLIRSFVPYFMCRWSWRITFPLSTSQISGFTTTSTRHSSSS